MRKILTFSLLLSLLSLPLVAQPGGIRVQSNPLPNTRFDWELKFDFEVPNAVEGAFLLELPPDLQPVPVTVAVNGKQLWLQNLLSVPQGDSMVAWQLFPEGLLMLFKPGVLKQGDRVEINCLVTVKRAEEKTGEVALKAVIWSAGRVQIVNRALASGTIPAFTNR